ncbi:MAG: type IV toxin-antitoxin system AbiEi family antitoxin domain-containing protein [Cryobacterium sp.]|nr:type IV toxin-antitoxin system AbiEi family antitoxin domain-containing protein [Cryobacterium sp.]
MLDHDIRDLHLTHQLNGIVRTRDLTIPGERSDFYRRVRAGEFTRVVRGAYLPTTTWNELGPDAQYRVVVAASDRPGFVFSHHSAAAMWRLPWIGPWPHRIHLAEQADAGRLSTPAITRHTTGVPPSVEVIDGLTVTSLARTVVDLACALTFERAVTIADAALRRTAHPLGGLPATTLSRHDLQHELARVPVNRGAVKARNVIAFADPQADRPGESLSRVSMLRARLPAPQLQAPLRGRSGREWRVDFYWPGNRLIGEFDGEWKYTNPEFANERTPKRILLDEKFREDDLRAANYGFARWGWGMARSPAQLRRHLLDAGLQA